MSIEFDEPLDFSPAVPNTTGRIWIESSANNKLDANIQAETDRASVRLNGARIEPSSVLRVSSDLEDLAGNSIARPFERQASTVNYSDVPEVISIPLKQADTRHSTSNKR